MMMMAKHISWLTLWLQSFSSWLHTSCITTNKRYVEVSLLKHSGQTCWREAWILGEKREKLFVCFLIFVVSVRENMMVQSSPRKGALQVPSYRLFGARRALSLYKMIWVNALLALNRRLVKLKVHSSNSRSLKTVCQSFLFSAGQWKDKGKLRYCEVLSSWN